MAKGIKNADEALEGVKALAGNVMGWLGRGGGADETADVARAVSTIRAGRANVAPARGTFVVNPAGVAVPRAVRAIGPTGDPGFLRAARLSARRGRANTAPEVGTFVVDPSGIVTRAIRAIGPAGDPGSLRRLSGDRAVIRAIGPAGDPGALRGARQVVDNVDDVSSGMRLVDDVDDAVVRNTSPLGGRIRTWATSPRASRTGRGGFRNRPLEEQSTARVLASRIVRGPRDAGMFRRTIVPGAAVLGGLGTIGALAGRGEEEALDPTLAAELSNITSIAPTSERQLRALDEAYALAEAEYAAQERALDEMLANQVANERRQAEFLRNYGTNTAADIQNLYGVSGEEALRAAAEIEALGNMAAGSIRGSGAAGAEQARMIAEQPGAVGPTAVTGLVPVSGQLAVAPEAIARDAAITAGATGRQANITRDDLRAFAAMAGDIGRAYGNQLSGDVIAQLALQQMQNEQARNQMAYEERRGISANRAELALQRAGEERAILEEVADTIGPDNATELLNTYRQLSGSPEGQAWLAANNIQSFTDYVESLIGEETLRRLQGQ